MFELAFGSIMIVFRRCSVAGLIGERQRCPRSNLDPSNQYIWTQASLHSTCLDVASLNLRPSSNKIKRETLHSWFLLTSRDPI